MRLFLTLLFCALPLCAGCEKGAPTKGLKIGDAPAPGNLEQAGEPADLNKKGLAGIHDLALQEQPKGGNPRDKKIERQRKIRRTADMRLVVNDFSTAVKQLMGAMKEHKGLEANTEINSTPNTVRTGKWVIRIPSDQFDQFREAVASIGDVEKHTVDSEDLTDKYYDLEAHVENRRKSRDAMRKLLEKVGELDVDQHMKVSDRLDAITDEINRKEGMLKLWENLTDLTTVTVHLREREPFLLTKVKDREDPSFGTRLSAAWDSSWGKFVGFVQGAVIVAAALTPWLPIPIVFFGFVFLIARWKRSLSMVPVVLVATEAPPGNKQS